jgi:LysM repeat protein
MAYSFFMVSGTKKVQFPIAPSELTISVNGRNESVDLMNEGEVNLLKSPGLTEVSFTALIPHPQLGKYPFATNSEPIDTFTNFLNDVIETKTPFRFVVVRTAGTKLLFDTNLKVACEGYQLKESVDNGFDVELEVSLKQYRDFGIKTVTITTVKTNTSVKQETPNNTSKPAPTTQTPSVNVSNNRDTTTKKTTAKKKNTYTIKNGDTLWSISKKYYGTGSKWKTIYTANKSTIENVAKKHGKKSSSTGHWIWAGTKLTIP